MNPNQKNWNEQQQKLRFALTHLGGDHQEAIDLFLSQHAMLHAAQVSQSGLWSYEDEIMDGLTEADIRCIPPGRDHSIAWVLWHLTRIEDVTMNMLVAGSPQLFFDGEWHMKTKFLSSETGNALDKNGIAILSSVIEIDDLRNYRKAVGRRTREIVKQLQPGELKQKVDPARLENIVDETAVVEATMGLVKYWGGLTIAGLLLMPPTRHTFIHLNEAARLKTTLKKFQTAKPTKVTKKT